MALDFKRAIDAAEAATNALTDELSRRNTPENPATENDVLVATAILVHAVTETASVDFDGFTRLFERVREIRSAGRAG